MIGILSTEKLIVCWQCHNSTMLMADIFVRDDYDNIIASQFKMWLANLDFDVANRKTKVVEDVKDQED